MHRFYAAVLFFCLVIPLLPSEVEALPFYFTDQLFYSLEQLDLALEEGEISQEDYDILLEVFVSEIGDDYQRFNELIAGDVYQRQEIILPLRGISYHGNYVQGLEDEYDYTRYDRIKIKTDLADINLSLEQGTGGQLFCRSRSIKMRCGHGSLTIGSYNLKVGNGLTQGYSAFIGEFRRRDDFEASLTQPIKNRENGVLASQLIGKGEIRVYGSYLRGVQFEKTVYGAAFQFGKRWKHVGIIAIQQRLAVIDGQESVKKFIAPFFKVKLRTIRISGESSFGLGHTSAHLYSLAHQSSGSRLEAKFFSYGKYYQNLQSGGYAYSDYKTSRINQVELAYSEKRAGRLGISVSSGLRLTSNLRFSQTLVRWRARLNSRQCIAAKAAFQITNPAGMTGNLKLEGIWENRDLIGDGSSRRVLVVTSKSHLVRNIKLITNHKIERRQYPSSRSYPFRTKYDLQVPLTNDLQVMMTINYYDPDIKKSGNSYCYLSAGQVISQSKAFKLKARVRCRYLLDGKGFEDWELRIECDIVS